MNSRAHSPTADLFQQKHFYFLIFCNVAFSSPCEVGPSYTYTPNYTQTLVSEIFGPVEELIFAETAAGPHGRINSRANS